jgi:hypothetical protein
VPSTTGSALSRFSDRNGRTIENRTGQLGASLQAGFAEEEPAHEEPGFPGKGILWLLAICKEYGLLK